MFSWLKKLLGTNATSATSSTEDATKTAFNNSNENAESVDSSDNKKFKQEDGTNECHDNIDFCNDKPQESPEEWDNSYIDNSRYALELKSILERVCFGKNDPIGVTIALTGALGAGKSSVINRVRNDWSDLKRNTVVECSEQDNITPMILHKEDIKQYALKISEAYEAEIQNTGNYARKISEAYEAESQNTGKEIFRQNDIELHCSYFKCYWFPGEDGLALSFISYMVSEVSLLVSDEARKLIIEISTLLIKFLLPGSEKAVDLLKNQIVKDFSINEKIERLDYILQQKKDKRRFLVIIDDLDRMEKNEILAILRIIKTFGSLRNLVFLLVYDNDIVSSVANSHFPEAKGKYLDKFIQFHVDIMPARRASIVEQLKNRVLSMMEKDHKEIWDNSLNSNERLFEEIKGKSDESNDSIKFNDLSLDDLIANYVKTPRELNLIAMATSNSWIKCNKLICCRDLIALEILKRYEKEHYLNLCDVADEFDFKKSFFRINTYDLQYVTVANSWHKGATALSMSFENPCLMVLFINGYENFKKGCEVMFRRTLKATHLEYISNKAEESLVKAFIQDLKEICENLFNGFYIAQYPYIPGAVPGIFSLDYYIDNAIILIKGEVKHSEVFYSLINSLMDIVLELDLATQSEKLSIKENEDVLKPILDELQSWIGRAVCDNKLLKSNKIYCVQDIFNRLQAANSTKHLRVIYGMFKMLTNNKFPVHYSECNSCAKLFFNTVKLAVSNGDLFNHISSYEILRDCKSFFIKTQYKLNHCSSVMKNSISTVLYDFNIVKDDISKELRVKIEKNECILQFYLSCATYLNVPYDFYSLGNEIYQEKLQSLSNEFYDFLKFYNLDPKMIYEQLIKLEQGLIDHDEEGMYSDIHNLIEIINRKLLF